SANDLRLNFGLEKLNKIDSVEIRWPSGLTESYRDLPVNHLLILKEGASYQLQRLNSF
ncbi:ASPIC/UnbV domain-containing protein, partial [candidate division KSB1 bacterium]|nr:ASPIC/UnbV domain-containing protein [candidate division KSB1 bacterium]